MLKNKLHLQFLVISLLVTIIEGSLLYFLPVSGVTLFLPVILVFFLLINTIYFLAVLSLKHKNSRTFTSIIMAGSTIKLFLAGGLFYLLFIDGEKEIMLSKLTIVLLFFVIYMIYSSLLYFFLLKLNRSYQEK